MIHLVGALVGFLCFFINLVMILSQGFSPENSGT